MEGFVRGLHMYYERTSTKIEEKQEKFSSHATADLVIMDSTISVVESMLHQLKVRRRLIQEKQVTTKILSSIRKKTFSFLKKLKPQDHESFEDTVIHNIECIDRLVLLEEIPLPTAAIHSETLTAFLKKIRPMNENLKTEVKHIKEVMNHQRKIEEKLTEINALLSPNTFSSQKIDNNVLDILLKDILGSESCTGLLKRELPVVCADRVWGDHNASYEDPEELLDCVIYSEESYVYAGYILTLPYFSNVQELITQLLVRLSIFPGSASEEEISSHKTRMLNFITFWLFNSCCRMKEAVKEALTHFIESIIYPIGGKEMGSKMIKMLCKGQKTKLEFPVLSPHSPTTLDLLTMYPKVFAEQQTLFQHAFYRALVPSEFLGQVWNKKLKEDPCPNLRAYTTLFNHTSHWYIHQILKIESMEGRGVLLSQLIHILLLLFRLNNFFGCFALLFALNSLPIFRLYDSWSLVEEEKRVIVQTLCTFTADSFKMYKKEIQLISEASIPYLGPVLGDLTFIEDGNETFSPDGKINYHFKCCLVQKVIDRALKHRKWHYQICSKEDTQQWLQTIFICEYNEDEVYDRSKALEDQPTAGEPFDISSAHLQDFTSLREASILETFTSGERSDRISSIRKIGANDFIKAKVAKSFSSRRRSSVQDVLLSPLLSHSKSNEIMVESINMDSSLNSLLVHMKLSKGGISLQEELSNRRIITFFTTSQLVDWLTEYTHQPYYTAMVTAGKMVDSGLIARLDSDAPADPLCCVTNPLEKLKFCDKYQSYGFLGNSGDLTVSLGSVTHDWIPLTTSTSSECIIDEQTLLQYYEIVDKMKDPESGVKVKTRKWMFRKFPHCFVGEQAVTWLCTYMRTSNRKKAVRLGRKMAAEGHFYHVASDHDFEDKYLFYQFAGAGKAKK